MSRAVLSIRHKLILAVTGLYALMIASAIGTYYYMHQLEEKIVYLEELSKLEESVLEVRRFEKNYFLYDDPKSLDTAIYHLGRVTDLVNRNASKIEELSSGEELSAFSSDLRSFGALMANCSDSRGGDECVKSSDSRSEQEATIRQIGTRISEFAEGLARRKRQSIRETMHTAVRLQFLVFSVIAVGFTIHGAFLVSKVIKPLRLLEQSTEKIANGQFRPIRDLPPEKEIREIFDSFNRMAEQLKIREEQLVQSKKLASLGTMLAGVAHEVNNPLSNISSSCEILIEEIDDGDKEWQKDLLKKVLEQVDKARSIVINLLEFSRNKDFSKETFNLKQLIEKTLTLLHGQVPSAIEMVVEVEDGLELYADKQRFQQALMNLIANAVQSIIGSGAVTIKGFRRSDGLAEIVVKDSGKGISPEDLPRIFDPFFTTKDIGHGTGLGLFITHDIILRHQGSIRVESNLGKGTTFFVKVPLHETVS